MIAEIATVFAGAVSVGVHTNLSESEITSMLAHANTTALLCDGGQLGKVAHLGYRLLCMGSREWVQAVSLSPVCAAGPPPTHPPMCGAVNRE